MLRKLLSLAMVCVLCVGLSAVPVWAEDLSDSTDDYTLECDAENVITQVNQWGDETYLVPDGTVIQYTPQKPGLSLLWIESLSKDENTVSKSCLQRNGELKNSPVKADKAEPGYTYQYTLGSSKDYNLSIEYENSQITKIRFTTIADRSLAEGKWTQDSVGRKYCRADGSYPQNKWEQINGKQYFFDENGYLTVGWKEIDKKWYYFNDRGAMSVGWVKDRGKWYYLDESGKMLYNTSIDGYTLGADGVWDSTTTLPTGYFHNKLSNEQNSQALEIAQQIADSIGPGTDIERVYEAACRVDEYCRQCRYTMEGPNYSEAYGVFVAKEYSCAGSTRALGLVLTCMGYEWKHVNENAYSHQWCTVMMDGQEGWADAFPGSWKAGYGSYM